MATESKYQLKLRRDLESKGWLVIRLLVAPTSIAATGTPDLLALKPCQGGRCVVKFIEVKAKNGKTSPLQEFHIKKLKEFGFEAIVDREF